MLFRFKGVKRITNGLKMINNCQDNIKLGLNREHILLRLVGIHKMLKLS